MTDSSGNMTFGYDARGRLVEKTSVINSLAYSVFRSYTMGGRISSVTYPTGRTIDYDRTTCAYSVDAVSTTYNANTIPLANNLSYRPYGIARGMNTGAGGTVNNIFDLSGRLTVANPGTDKERTYTYDNNGNLTSVSAPNTPWHNRAYTYDALNRLNHAEGPYGIIDYTYDAIGNRLTKVVGGQTETYTYITGTNKLNEIIGTDTIPYTYDANGNITNIGNKILTYNQNNRLIIVEENGTTLGEYTYNGLGQRVIKEVDGGITVFHYDFNGNIIAESDLGGNFTKEYLYRGKSRSAMVDVVSGEMYYFLNDRLGTPQMLTNSDNTVVWEGYYKPFGEADVNPNSSVVNNFRFLGQYYDQEAGLHYNYYRYYDPKTGRYLRADPLHLGNVQIARQNFQTALNATLLYQYALSTPQAFNYYVYVYDNPVNWTDPMGLMGFALSGGGAYGSGWGQRDPKAYSASAGTGVYIGAKKGGYAEIGGFSYQAEGKPPGAKFGLGIDLTLYYSDAEKFFHGAVKYSSRTWRPFTVTEYYDQCEKVIGHTFSIFGRGIGLTGLEKGTSTGWIYPLQ